MQSKQMGGSIILNVRVWGSEAAELAATLLKQFVEGGW